MLQHSPDHATKQGGGGDYERGKAMVNGKMYRVGWRTAQMDIQERGLDWSLDHFRHMDEQTRIDPDFRLGYGFVVLALDEKRRYEAIGREWPYFPCEPLSI